MKRTSLKASRCLRKTSSAPVQYGVLRHCTKRPGVTSRCIDLPELVTHTNGTPNIYKYMTNEDSDMMVWLGDATHLLGLGYTMGVVCPVP